jgi:hypothetical protein
MWFLKLLRCFQNTNGINTMNLIFTMAGKYSRFVNAGYKIPKYLLPWSQHTILSEILSQMTTSTFIKNVFLIANKQEINFAPVLLKTMAAYGINNDNLIFINDTTSQSETALVGTAEIQKRNSLKGSICFHNIDTILYSRNYAVIYEELINNHGYIDTFISNNQQYSYVSVNGNYIDDIQEKILISNIASSGFYGFSSIDIFHDYYENDYISKIYKNMIADDKRIICGKTYDERNTIVLGTPQDYFTHLQTF